MLLSPCKDDSMSTDQFMALVMICRAEPTWLDFKSSDFPMGSRDLLKDVVAMHNGYTVDIYNEAPFRRCAHTSSPMTERMAIGRATVQVILFNITIIPMLDSLF